MVAIHIVVVVFPIFYSSVVWQVDIAVICLSLIKIFQELQSMRVVSFRYIMCRIRDVSDCVSGFIRLVKLYVYGQLIYCIHFADNQQNV